MIVLPRPLFIGHPFGVDLPVKGASRTDEFTLIVASTATGAPVALSWVGTVDSDGLLRVSFTAGETAALAPGTYAAELGMRRGSSSGVLGGLFTLAVQAARMPPAPSGDHPLLSASGQRVELSLIGAVASPISIAMELGLKGDDGAPGPPGQFYQHAEPAPASLWTIAHNLGHRPSVSTFTLGGSVMLGEVLHLSVNVLTITFLTPVAGTAHLV